MITNNQKFRILNPESIVYTYNTEFALFLTFLHKGEDGLWWCLTENGDEIAINPLNYAIVKEA